MPNGQQLHFTMITFRTQTTIG